LQVEKCVEFVAFIWSIQLIW